MSDLKNPKIAIPIVLFAGILWSFGPYVVRHIDQPETVPWQYLLTRGLVIFFLLNIYLFLEEGSSFYKNYLKVGTSGLIGGIGGAKCRTAAAHAIHNGLTQLDFSNKALHGEIVGFGILVQLHLEEIFDANQLAGQARRQLIPFFLVFYFKL